MEVKKSPKADLEGGIGMSILMGMIVGLAVLFVGFEWGSKDVQVVTADEGVADIIAEEEIEITRPENTPPPPPPPPAPAVTEVLNVWKTMWNWSSRKLFHLKMMLQLLSRKHSWHR